MKKHFLLIFILFHSSLCARETINVMFYNIYRFPERPPSKRENILKEILNEFQPDLLMVCELVTEYGADRILETALATPEHAYRRTDFIPIRSDTTDPLHQMVFYNQHKFLLVKEYIYPTTVRDINHYTFVLNTENLATDSVFLEVFVAHFKSSEGAANQNLRSGMADTFLRALTTVPNERHVILAGDFNFYTDNEPAYQKIIDKNNNIVLVDPIDKPGSWHDNEIFSDIHTQATRTSAQGFGIGGATGGMDDRFDFIFMSENFESGNKIRYVPGSYKAMGNNGNCYNHRIDAYDCSGAYSLELRQLLHRMSDHTPVIMQLESPARFVSVAQKNKSNIMSLAGENNVTEFIDINLALPVPLKNSYIDVYNYMGNCLKRIAINKQNQMLPIYTGDLTPGIYFLTLNVPGWQREVLKFIRR